MQSLPFVSESGNLPPLAAISCALPPPRASTVGLTPPSHGRPVSVASPLRGLPALGGFASPQIHHRGIWGLLLRHRCVPLAKTSLARASRFPSGTPKGKEPGRQKPPWFFCEGMIKKIFFVFQYGFEPKSRRKACISSMQSIVYHQRLAVVYHHCERGYSLRLMIYSPCRDILGKADEIHAKA